jgi:hypothetical protein
MFFITQTRAVRGAEKPDPEPPLPEIDRLKAELAIRETFDVVRLTDEERHAIRQAAEFVPGSNNASDQHQS